LEDSFLVDDGTTFAQNGLAQRGKQFIIASGAIVLYGVEAGNQLALALDVVVEL
jgi:hypothetical protein